MISRFISDEPLTDWHDMALDTQQILDAMMTSIDAGDVATIG